MGHWRLKDDAIIAVLTTRCSSAFALIASCWAVVSAQSPIPRPHPLPNDVSAKRDRTPPALVPTQPVWSLALNAQLAAAPAYDERRAYFPIEGDRLVAYDIASGNQAWIVTARPALDPVAGGGLVFIIEPGVLKAFDAESGSIAWQIPFTEKLAVPPVWDNGWLIVASDTGEVGALRGSDGAVIWRRNVQSPAHARPALAADRVYVPTTDSRVVALRVDTGEPIWERRLGGAPNDILALDRRIYVGSTDNFFYCLMTKDGSIDWRWRAGGDVIGLPVADERRVYFTALDNVLRALDRNSGVQHWMRPLPMRPIAGPIIAGSTMIVAGQEAPLRAYNINDGVAGAAPTIAPGAPEQKPAAPVVALFGGTEPPLADLSTLDATTLTSTIPPEVVPAAAEAFVDLSKDSEIAAPPHLVPDPQTRLPLVIMITRDIARGAGVTLVRRDFEPPITPLAALPNMIMIAPTTPLPLR
jgi:outer membrane protein assembly factor BamB